MRPLARHSGPGTLLTLASCLACLYVAGRLWATSSELDHTRRQLMELSQAPGQQGSAAHGSVLHSSPHLQNHPELPLGGDLFVSSRKQDPGGARSLSGPTLTSAPPVRRIDENLLGQVDAVEAGEVSGWACLRGAVSVQPLQVVVYVDGIQIGEAAADRETPHHIVHRLCESDAALSSATQQAAQQLGVGFRVTLPSLSPGSHQVRAFVRNKDGSAQQELNQSPLGFQETEASPGLEEALKRKDAIIRVRNAQVATLWDELHTRQPWNNALKEDGVSINLDSASASNQSTRGLAVLGINTGLGARVRRDNLRSTWVPTGEAMRKLEAETGLFIRFIIGYSEQKDDPDEVKLQEEMRQYGDILRVDVVDTYGDLSMKTLKTFATMPGKIDADFYFKVDDDVAVNVAALTSYLQQRRIQGNLYLGCMKSGQVLTDRRFKWFEPEGWRFGDAAAADGAINYPRHASGQIYGLSGPVAKYIRRNAPILHRFANEDVTLGAWLLGLEVTHVDERRLCCDSAQRCAAQTSEADLCLSYYEHQCAGICNSEKRLGPIYRSCLQDPLRTGANPGSIPRIDEGSVGKDPALELKDAKELKALKDPTDIKGAKEDIEPKDTKEAS